MLGSAAADERKDYLIGNIIDELWWGKYPHDMMEIYVTDKGSLNGKAMCTLSEWQEAAQEAVRRYNEGEQMIPLSPDLKGYIDGVRRNYDYILIDCMPSLGMMTINSLVAADSVIIPSQPNFLSTKGLNLLMRSIAKIRKQINPRLNIDGILLTMVDSRTNNAKDIISSLRSSMGTNIRVFETEIPHSVRAAECSLAGKSIFSHDRSGKVAAAYEQLTKEVTDIGRETQNRSRSDWVR